MGCGLSSGESLGPIPDQTAVSGTECDHERTVSPPRRRQSVSVDGIACRNRDGTRPNLLRQRKGSENEAGTLTGGTAVVLDTRENPVEDHSTRPSVARGTLWEDPDFGENTAFFGLSDEVFYRRPKEVCDKPSLYTYGTTRFDIVQGRVGTCYLLAVIASLAEKPDLLNQIIISQDYDPESSHYDGVLHFRFWKFGKWVDVYIDDRIPVYESDGRIHIWAAKSEDPDELWVTFLEKAYTKEFGGSYAAVYGGTASDAFTNLTGGVTEFVDMADVGVDKLEAFHQLVTVALDSGSLVTCICKDERNGIQGMVGSHSYTLTGTGSVGYQGNTVKLFRIRNTWGAGEWTGSWSDNSEEWKHVSVSAKQSLQVQGKIDGEFWMNIDDFFINFSSTVICNFTPDFDQDGKQDGLNNVCTIIGEWRGKTAAGQEDMVKFRNPKFEFVVPEKAAASDVACQILIQCLQKKKNRSKDQFDFVRVDVYVTEAQLEDGSVIYREITNNLKYRNGRELCYRYTLGPGKYLIIPSTLYAGREREFLIRTFSTSPLSCREIRLTSTPIVRRSNVFFEFQGQTYHINKSLYLRGSWRRGYNAGGQVKNKQTFQTNPQYELVIKGPGLVPMSAVLIQECVDEKIRIGLKLWKADGQRFPLDTVSLYSVWPEAVKTTTEQGTFIRHWEVEATYLLKPGRYGLIVFTDEPDQQKGYTLCMNTAVGCAIEWRAYNR